MSNIYYDKNGFAYMKAINIVTNEEAIIKDVASDGWCYVTKNNGDIAVWSPEEWDYAGRI